jgi:hypothetical protein
MADFIYNKLTIKCADIEIRNKIKMMIFTENDKKEQIFTMEKLLPMPKGFSDSVGYNEFGRDWSYAVWGTKWAQSYKISESGDTIIIDYQTPWDPNLLWVKTLCRYIDYVSDGYKYKTDSGLRNMITVTLTYYCDYDDCGNTMEWKTYKGFTFFENVKLF